MESKSLRQLRKEKDLHEDAYLEIELKKEGWNTDPMSIQEFCIIHQEMGKNLVSKLQTQNPNKVKTAIKPTVIKPKIHR